MVVMVVCLENFWVICRARMAEAAQSRVQSAIKDFINQIDKVE